MQDKNLFYVCKQTKHPLQEIIPVAHLIADGYGLTEPFTDAEVRILISLIDSYVDRHRLINASRQKEV